MHLQMMYVAELMAFSTLFWSGGLLILFLSGYRRRLTGTLLIPAGVLSLAAAVFISFGVICYFKYGN